MNKEYKVDDYFALAHVRKDGYKQYLYEHLHGVGANAYKFAKKIGLGDYGKLIGLLHDLGKFSEEFQNYLKSAVGIINPDEDDFVDSKGLKGKIDHSTAGAQFVFQAFADKGQEGKLIGQILALCIASHHSGLIDCLSPEGENLFLKRMNKADSKTHLNEVLEKKDKGVFREVNNILSSPSILYDIKTILVNVHDKEEKSKTTTFFKQGLPIRMLFSCLIDADRIDTADFENPNSAKLRNNNNYKTWDELIEKLETRLLKFKVRNQVDQIRNEISNNCKSFSERERGIFTLTVPTGGGKTLASLRFALHHAKKYEMDRIFYIIPFTSIIDQNAEELRSFLEDKRKDGSYTTNTVLEHHSNLSQDEATWKQKILSENWDSPIIFTTNVQFLETLFDSGTRGARRMHQFVNSIIIFDEVQALPIRCIHMFNNAINFLVKNCGATVVLSSATQPILHNVSKQLGALKVFADNEMMPDKQNLFKELKRVKVMDKRKTGGWSYEEVSDLARKELNRQLSENKNLGSVLLIVNTKKSARVLYDLISNSNNCEVYHLSTSMCPTHRLKILDEVRNNLDINNPKPIICISTQLIEAGVDVDFGSVIRFTAGLDSIAQAAGRCNRNGLRETGLVYIVNPSNENIDKLKDIKVGKEIADRVLDEYKNDPMIFDNDILSPKTIERYFQYYFFDRVSEMKYPVNSNSGVGRDDSLLELLSENFFSADEYKRINNEFPELYFRQSFMTAAKEFKAIDSPTQGIIVPYGEIGKQLILDFCSAEEIEKQYKLLREAQRYSVNVFSTDFKKLKDQKAIYEVQEGTGIYYLLEDYYSYKFGLSTERVTLPTVNIV